MSRITFIEHKGKEILFCDYSHLKREEKETIIKTVNEEVNIIAQQPLDSLLVLTDITGTYVDKEIDDKFTEMIKRNKPYVKRSAVLGIEGLKKTIYNIMMIFQTPPVAGRLLILAAICGDIRIITIKSALQIQISRLFQLLILVYLKGLSVHRASLIETSPKPLMAWCVDIRTWIIIISLKSPQMAPIKSAGG